MIDIVTKKPMKLIGEDGQKWLSVPLSQMFDVRQLLDAHGVFYWVEEFSISFDNAPLVGRLTISRREDRAKVQAILDGVDGPGPSSIPPASAPSDDSPTGRGWKPTGTLAYRHGDHSPETNPSVIFDAIRKSADSFDCHLTAIQAIELARHLLAKAQSILDYGLDDAAVQLWNTGATNDAVHIGLAKSRRPRQEKGGTE